SGERMRRRARHVATARRRARIPGRLPRRRSHAGGDDALRFPASRPRGEGAWRTLAIRQPRAASARRRRRDRRLSKIGAAGLNFRAASAQRELGGFGRGHRHGNVQATNARGRKDETEHRPLADLAFYVELAAVTLYDVLDDGQTETGTARFARAAGVDAIKALRQTGQVLAGDAAPGVRDSDLARAVVVDTPTDIDVAPIGRIANGVVHEIG